MNINIELLRKQQCFSPCGNTSMPRYTGLNLSYKFDKLNTNTQPISVTIDGDGNSEIQMNEPNKDAFLEIMGLLYDQSILVKLDK